MKKSSRGQRQRVKNKTPSKGRTPAFLRPLMETNPHELLSNGVPVGVRDVLMDVLGVSDEEITPDASLEDTLGLESIDRLDLIFQLEKKYKVVLPRKEWTPEDILTSSNYVTDGLINARGLAEIERRMPYADLTTFKQKPLVRDFERRVQTVIFLRRYLEYKEVQFVPAPETTPA